MKKVLCLLMVLVTMFGSTITVEAASSTKEYDKKFKAYYNRLENQVNEQYENLSKEEKKIVTNIDMDYIKMGYGMYEILMSFEMYGDDVVTADIIYDIVLKDYSEKLKDIPKEIQNEFEKSITLSILDKNWMNQLDNMEHLKEGIGLRGYAQTNPLQAYALEGFELFDNMLKETNKEITTYLLKAEIRQNLERVENKNIRTNDASESVKKQPKKVEKKVGRNDPCPCGSGKKYKQCCGK